MSGEGQLVNLMHARYVAALADFVTMAQEDLGLDRCLNYANKLSTMNVEFYRTKWDKVPDPQKILEIVEGRVVVVDKK